jgi:hypothetical protein
VNSPTEGIQVTDALEYWTLSRDLMEQLAALGKPGAYTIVYKGGPNDGIIESGADASRTMWLLGATKLKGEHGIIQGKPKIGRGLKGASHPFMFAMIYGHMGYDQIYEIYKTAGFDLSEVFKSSGVHYHIENIIDDIVVMKFYPPGEPCPCEAPVTTEKDNEGNTGQNKNPAG